MSDDKYGYLNGFKEGQSLLKEELVEKVEGMKPELPSILWKDDHEENLIKQVEISVLNKVLTLIKGDV